MESPQSLADGQPLVDETKPALTRSISLRTAFVADPRAAFQKLVDVARVLCEAHAAGDERLLENLCKFAAAGHEAVASRYRLKSEQARPGAANVLAAAGHDQRRLLAMLGHELRSHLSPTKNACELLRRAVPDSAVTKGLCDIIDRQVAGMTRIVDELLDDARLRPGMVELHRRETTLEAIIARSVELAPLVGARNHTLLVDLGVDSLRVHADELWLSHALQNVISNAAKYTDPGGRIEVRVTRDRADAVISVHDTGVGLTPEQLETIFDLYVQGEQPPDRPSVGGLGVGLNLARLLIERHGGTIQASSEGLGRGSVFTIRLPCLPPSAKR